MLNWSLIFGISGFALGVVNLFIKVYEVYSLKPKIYVFPILNFSETIRKIHNGEYNGKIEHSLWLHFDFIFTNNGGRQVQITDLFILMKNKKENEYYNIKLSHSTDFQPMEFQYDGSDKFIIKDEIINLPGHSSTRKHYIIDFNNLELVSYIKANKRLKHNQYLEIHTSDAKIIYKKIL